MWVMIAVRLIIPFNMDIPFPQMVIDIPTEITVPINTNNKSCIVKPAKEITSKHYPYVTKYGILYLIFIVRNR